MNMHVSAWNENASGHPGWVPGNPRRLRVFMSHRYGADAQLYEAITLGIRQQFDDFDDLSLPEDRRIQTPRGREPARHDVMKEIAARIYVSDVVIAPAQVAAGLNDWVSTEIEFAALAYCVPLLFVRMPEMQRHTGLIQKLRLAGLQVSRATFEPENAPGGVKPVTRIIQAMARMLDLPMKYAPCFPFERSVDPADNLVPPGLLIPPQQNMHFRGPDAKVLAEVMRKYPYRPLATRYTTRMG